MEVRTSILLIFLLVSCAMNTSLDIPAGSGELVKVKAEINSRTDVNSKDAAEQIALMYASEQGRMEVFDLTRCKCKCIIRQLWSRSSINVDKYKGA